MFRSRTPDPVFDYISPQDPAVDDGAIEPKALEKYLQTLDSGLIEHALVEGKKPTVFRLALLPEADRSVVLRESDDERGQVSESVLEERLVAMALRGWENPQEGAPPWRTVRMGFHRIVAPEVLDYIGPDLGRELSLVLWMLNFPAPGAERPPSLVEEVEGN